MHVKILELLHPSLITGGGGVAVLRIGSMRRPSPGDIQPRSYRTYCRGQAALFVVQQCAAVPRYLFLANRIVYTHLM
jgi:hypothetical protein